MQRLAKDIIFPHADIRNLYIQDTTYFLLSDGQTCLFIDSFEIKRMIFVLTDAKESNGATIPGTLSIS